MKLYHATTREALESIAREGLCVRYAASEARIKGVWLHTRSNTPWAILHTQRRHGATLENVVILELWIARSQLRRFKKGLWYTRTDIAVEQIVRVIDGTEFALSAK